MISRLKIKGSDSRTGCVEKHSNLTIAKLEPSTGSTKDTTRMYSMCGRARWKRVINPSACRDTEVGTLTGPTKDMTAGLL